jgi:hypothetical protein
MLLGVRQLIAISNQSIIRVSDPFVPSMGLKLTHFTGPGRVSFDPEHFIHWRSGGDPLA